MGGAASELFAAEGAKVAIIDRNGEAAAATAAAIRARATSPSISSPMFQTKRRSRPR